MHVGDLGERHHRSLTREHIDVLERLEVESLGRHRSRDDVDEILTFAQL